MRYENIFNGCTQEFNPSSMNPDRGLYFSTDMEYSLGYGNCITQCHVTLERPCVFTQTEAEGYMELDRHVLIGMGFDGRVIQYDDGNMDVIAFYPYQVEVVPMASPAAGTIVDNTGTAVPAP